MATKKPKANLKSDASKLASSLKTSKNVKANVAAKKLAPADGTQYASKATTERPAGVAIEKSTPRTTYSATIRASAGGFDELLRDSQAAITTWLTAMSLLGQGAEEASAAWSTYYCSSVETGFAVGKQLLRAKSFNEAAELQRSYTTSGLEALVTETTKLTEISVKAAGAATVPIAAHCNQTLTRWRQSMPA